MNLDERSSDDEEQSMSPLNNSNAEKLRKITHSEIERRRREKMNRYIDEIAQLLPIDAVKKLDKLTVLRVAVDTIKHLKGSSSKASSVGFGKQIYLNDNELLELTLATMDQLGTYFFLIIECNKGRICYASSSVETTLGYKPIELCSQSFFDLVYPKDLDLIRQQFIYERLSSPTTTDESSNDAKCISRLDSKKNSLKLGDRRSFSCRLRTKSKRSYRIPTTTTMASNNPSHQFCAIDFVGYFKEYALATDASTESKTLPERRRASLQTFTSADVVSAIGSSPNTCLLAMGNLSKTWEKIDGNTDSFPSIERMFLCKLNPDGQFTYFDRICYSLLGYLSHELLGMNFHDFVHEDDRNKLMDVWIRVCRDRQIVTSGNYRFRGKDNVYITFQTIFEPFIHPWTDELEIIVARNKIKSRSARTSLLTSDRVESAASVDFQSSTTIDSSELIHHYLP